MLQSYTFGRRTYLEEFGEDVVLMAMSAAEGEFFLSWMLPTCSPATRLFSQHNNTRYFELLRLPKPL